MVKFLLISDPRIEAARLAVPEGQVTIYALVDPTDGTVRYVGKTLDEDHRLETHMKLRQRNYALTKWLRELKAMELTPVLWVLQYVNATAWEEVEKYWIRFFRERGELYNLEAGGDRIRRRPAQDSAAYGLTKKLAEASKRQMAAALGRMNISRGSGGAAGVATAQIGDAAKSGGASPARDATGGHRAAKDAGSVIRALLGLRKGGGLIDASEKLRGSGP